MQSTSIGILVLGIFLATAFGGCVGGTENATDPSASSTPSESPTTSAAATSSAPADENNTAPNLTFTPAVVNGSVPLNVSFDLDAEDAEGDSLTWSFDADGDGTAELSGSGADLPANYTHLYTAAGVYNATFLASDGALEANKTIAIEVLAGVAAFTDLTFTGTISGAWVGDVTGVTGQGAYLPPDSADEHTFDLTAAPTSLTVSLTWDGMAGYDLDLILYSSDGEEVARATDVNIPGDDAETPIVVEDAAVLAKLGTWRMEVLSAGSLECDYTVLVDFA